jgi:glycosyltransferase involved in cell wall biosynthesis
MRVCIVGPAYPYRGGISHFTSLLALELQKDHDVRIVNFKRLYPSIFFPGKTQYDNSGSAIGTPSERLIDSLNPLSWWKAARKISAFAPDVVIFQWWHPFFAPAYAATRFFMRRRCKSGVVYLCHNVLPHESSIVDRTLIKIGFFGVKRFLVQSNEDKLRLLSLMKKRRGRVEPKIEVSPHPIYEVFKKGAVGREEARRELGLEGNTVLFFGLIRPYKGLNVLLEAFASASKRLDLTLLVVGEFYEDKEPYLRRIGELGIADRVRIVDRYVPNEEVEKYFEAADLVVLPYLSATQSGIVQIAYAFDKPVIVTSVGGLPDVVEDGESGRVVPPSNPAALADAMLEFFEKGESGRMVEGVRRIKARFSWRRCAETLVGLGRT